MNLTSFISECTFRDKGFFNFKKIFTTPHFEDGQSRHHPSRCFVCPPRQALPLQVQILPVQTCMVAIQNLLSGTHIIAPFKRAFITSTVIFAWIGLRATRGAVSVRHVVYNGSWLRHHEPKWLPGFFQSRVGGGFFKSLPRHTVALN